MQIANISMLYTHFKEKSLITSIRAEYDEVVQELKCLFHRRYRRVQLLKSMIWQVRFEDIDFVTALLHGSVRVS